MSARFLHMCVKEIEQKVHSFYAYIYKEFIIEFLGCGDQSIGGEKDVKIGDY